MVYKFIDAPQPAPGQQRAAPPTRRADPLPGELAAPDKGLYEFGGCPAYGGSPGDGQGQGEQAE